MKERILNCPIGKLPVKRMGILMLAFLCLLTMLPWQQARADDPVKSATEYDWHLIATQSDLPKTGVAYPMLLLYEDFGGNYHYLKSLREHTNGNHTLWRDGLDKAQSSMPPSVSKRFKQWLKDNGYPDYTDSKNIAPLYDLAYAETLGKFISSDRESMCILSHYTTKPIKSGSKVNYIQPDSLSLDEMLATGINPELKEFTTKTLVTSWELIVEGGQNKHKEHYIYLKCGDNFMFDEPGSPAQLDMRGYDSDDADDYMYSIYTSELGGDRYAYTPDGYCQIYWLHSGGTDSGLVWDTEGNLVGTIEKDNPCYSIFKMYYATERTVSLIDKDYTVPAGSVFYADDNTEIADGVNLFIAPGGVLSVNGVLHNNGTINVMGTMIMNPGSLVTSGLNEFNNTGQINVYNGDVDIISIVWSLDEENSKLRELYNKSKAELGEEIAQLEYRMVLLQYQYERHTDMSANPLSDEEYERVAQEYLSVNEEYSRLMKLYTSRFYEDPESFFKELEKEYDTKELYFTGCEGILVLLEDSVLLLPDKSESILNLYHGATCVNNGVMILPTGINVWGAELVNYEKGHIFLGYSYPTNVATANSFTFKNMGTENAAIVGATTLDDAVLSINLGEYFNITHGSLAGKWPSDIRNKGVIKSDSIGVNVGGYANIISTTDYDTLKKMDSQDLVNGFLRHNNGIVNIANCYVK